MIGGNNLTTQHREIFFLGAGASAHAQIPISYELGKKFTELSGIDWIDSETIETFRPAIRFIAGGLALQAGIEGRNPFDGIDVEALFNAAIQLADRSSLELAPFVSAWHPAINNFEQPSEVEIHEKIQIVADMIFGPYRKALLEVQEGKEFGQAFQETLEGILNKKHLMIKRHDMRFSDAFRDAVSKISGKHNSRHLFEDLQTFMVRLLKHYVWIDSKSSDAESRVKYLMPMLEYCKRFSVPMVSLNYDNCVELAAQYCKIRLSTGMEYWSVLGDFHLDTNSTILLKLHGSIDWKLTKEDPSDRYPLPQSSFDIGDPLAEDFFPSIIFGHRNKLTTEHPYLSMLLAFQRMLEDVDKITVFGYSFRDEHINNLLTAWLNRFEHRQLVIYNGPNKESYSLPFVNLNNKRFIKDRIVKTLKPAEKGIADLKQVLERDELEALPKNWTKLN